MPHNRTQLRSSRAAASCSAASAIAMRRYSDFSADWAQGKCEVMGELCALLHARPSTKFGTVWNDD